jgi:Ser/Thr protein kinase RdoA (MazF antagonist)
MSTPQDQTQYFYEITPDRILTATECADVKCTGRFMALNSMENRVYEVEIELPEDYRPKSPSERFRIIKFYRPGRWTQAQIQEEHDFLRELSTDEIPVVCPVELKDGKTVGVDPDSGIFFAVFLKVGGRSPEELNFEHCEWVGRLLARIHNVGRSKKATNRLVLNPTTYGRENLRFLQSHHAIPIELVKEYSETVEQICAISTPWFEATEFHRIHGDCHLGNLLWNDRGPFWVDFDDMVTGPAVQDFWLLLSGRDEHARQQVSHLLDSYMTMADFDVDSLRLIEPLRALRYVHYATWIAKRWKDPAFIRAFPQFGSYDYWQRQLADLRDQLNIIQRSASLPPELWPYQIEESNWN